MPQKPTGACRRDGNGNGNGIYIPHQIYIHIQMRFTLLQYKGEIGHQHI